MTSITAFSFCESNGFPLRSKNKTLRVNHLIFIGGWEAETTQTFCY